MTSFGKMIRLMEKPLCPSDGCDGILKAFAHETGTEGGEIFFQCTKCYDIYQSQHKFSSW
jgi:hypothetical protein